MRPEAYERLAAREDRYWWNRARRVMVAHLLKRHRLPQHCRWLDLGCGPGGNLTALTAFDPAMIVGLDLSPIAIAAARAKVPEADIVCGNLNNALPFETASFDLVTVFNVLYHQWVRDEAVVFGEIARVLRPGGLLLITEPAFASLRRSMDDVAMGKRRYRLQNIEALCRDAGLDMRQASYFTCFGFVLIYAMKILRAFATKKTSAKPVAAADLQPLNSVVNGLLYAIARLEGHAIAMGLCVPFGTTLVCVAAKRIGT